MMVARPLASIITLAGLMSRWMTPSSCAASSPSAIWRPISRALLQAGSGPCSMRGFERLPFDESHREEGLSLSLPDLVDRTDVGVM